MIRKTVSDLEFVSFDDTFESSYVKIAWIYFYNSAWLQYEKEAVEKCLFSKKFFFWQFWKQESYTVEFQYIAEVEQSKIVANNFSDFIKAIENYKEK